MQALALIVLLATALFYLGSRAVITRALWSSYPPALARFMDCAACTGFWWALLLTALVRETTTLATPFGLDTRTPLGVLMMGFVGIVLVPIAAGLMQLGLDTLGSAVADEE